MKILDTDQIRQADQHTIANEPISSMDLMERASYAFVTSFADQFSKEHNLALFCGIGNNGGDGLAVARILHEKSYAVEVFIVGSSKKGSQDFQVNLGRLPVKPVSLSANFAYPKLAENTIIIDALFGSGLNRPLEGTAAEVVEFINNTGFPIVSIDIASGLFADKALPKDAKVIKPAKTISFQLPKLAFLQPALAEFVGDWEIADIGLSEKYIEGAQTNFYFTEGEEVRSFLPSRDRFMHKGSAGRAQLWVGSKGMMGAAQLSAKACLRSGAGLVFIKSPEIGRDVIQQGVPEALYESDGGEDFIISPDYSTSADVVGIGPGIGTNHETARALEGFLLSEHGKKLVLDADALNLIAENRQLLELLPEGTILTPHPGEFRRIVGDWKDDFHKLDLLIELSSRYKLNVVLKGAFSAVSLQDGTVHFNPTGNPGMATGGSGDVLFGVICGLLAQRVSSPEAPQLGVYLHGLAGDLAKSEKSEFGLIASDIIEFLPKAFLILKG